jgi:hypothetical protein
MKDRPPATRRLVILVPFFLGLTLWLAAFATSGSVAEGPNGTRMGGDFAVFMGGATVLRHGGNPYDRVALYRAERDLLRRQHRAVPKLNSFIRVGNPPLLFWALEPLTTWSFVAATWLWIALMYALLALGFLFLLSFLGWTRWALPLAGFLAMPQTVLAAYYGNVDGLLFAALTVGLALLRRFPIAAGCFFAVAWLKPQVGLPVAGLGILFFASRRERAVAGFALASALTLFATGLATGLPSIGWWLSALTGYSRQIAVQPDLASLSGLYVYWSPDTLRVFLELFTIAVAAAATAFWWLRRSRGAAVPPDSVAWLFVLWYLATPFAHFHDQVVLALPILTLLGTDARALTARVPVTVLYLMLLSLLLFPTSRFHTDLQSLALLPIAGFALWMALRDPSRDHGSEARPSSLRQPSGWEGRAIAR